MDPQTPQGRNAYERPDRDELATRGPQHNWSAVQAMLAAFLVLVVIIAVSLLS